MALSTNTTLIPGYTVITDSVTGGIAVIRTVDDSTSYEYTIANEIADKLTIIATHLETISNSLNNGSTPVGTILSEMAQASENTSQSLASINNLAQGSGIHMVGPYDWLGLISSYIYYVEKGEILKTDQDLSEEKMLEAIEKLKDFFNEKIKKIPSSFDTK